MTSKLPVPTVGTIWASVLHKYSDNYAKYALEYFECFLLKHPTSNQNLSESLCLLGFERGGVFPDLIMHFKIFDLYNVFCIIGNN